jgi:hypothetical protein
MKNNTNKVHKFIVISLHICREVRLCRPYILQYFHVVNVEKRADSGTVFSGRSVLKMFRSSWLVGYLSCVLY